MEVLTRNPWANLMPPDQLHRNVSDWLVSQYATLYDDYGSFTPDFAGGGAGVSAAAAAPAAAPAAPSASRGVAADGAVAEQGVAAESGGIEGGASAPVRPTFAALLPVYDAQQVTTIALSCKQAHQTCAPHAEPHLKLRGMCRPACARCRRSM